MNFATRCALTIGYAWSAVALGASAADTAVDVSKVNGSIRIEDGQQAGDLSTVNGSVTVGADARVLEIDTVNGSLRIGERAMLVSAGTVNGSITLGAGAQVSDDIETVNGRITLLPGVRVGGSVGIVNGDLSLDGAEVRQGLETRNGDIHLATGTRLAGGIHVGEDRRSSWFGKGYYSKPRITIERGVVVEGPLHFEREVDLYVAPGVALPQVRGVPPNRHALQ